MRLTKRQLKRIIREEYSRLKRKGLIREMSDFGGAATGINVEEASYQLSRELMNEFPNGCTWDEGLQYSLSAGYSEEEYAYAIDVLGHQERGM